MLPFDDAEEWRDVVGWEGLYQVSSLGQVRSLPRPNRKGVGRILKYGIQVNGSYRAVTLSSGPRQSRRLVHLLVLEAFHGPRPDGMVGCHGPGGSQDNRASVLRWDTPSANSGRDRLRDGTLRIGESHPNARFTDEQVAEMRRRYSAGESQASLGRAFGTSGEVVGPVVTGKTWRHLPGAIPSGGTSRGESHYRSRLTVESVRLIRARHAAGDSQTALAREFGVSLGTVHSVVRRINWKDVA